jgi:uncharacterized protein YggE
MRITAALAAAILIVASGGRVLAAPAPMPAPPMGPDMMYMMAHHSATISVQGDGEVDYTPDEARLTLGVNGEDASAAAATADIAGRANAVIAALKSLGIPAGSITTNGFNLYYRQATETVKAAFVASESISVKSPVDKAGAVIDAGIRAGANQTYGLSYETTQRDALYKQAVQRAVKQARDLADAAASAAGLRLGAVMSISVGGAEPAPFAPVARMSTMAMAAPAPPPISPGTGTMTATVSVTYSIAMPGSSHP